MSIKSVPGQPSTWKMKYIHSIHSKNPTMNKTALKYAVGLGISAKTISQYWERYVYTKPVYQIKSMEESR